MNKFELSDRLKKLPPYLFVEIDKAKKKARDEGRDVIDLGVGDPDIPTPEFIIEALYEASKDPSTHRYSLDQGIPEYRSAASRWYKRRFGIDMSPDGEIHPLIGSKEGIAHMPLAYVNPGDAVLVPDPGYPPYRSGTLFAGGEVIPMPLEAKNSFLPDLGAIAPASLKKAKLMFINYPNNPTAAVCDKSFLKDVVSFAKKNNIIVCSDAAYSEIAFDGYRPPSIFEIDGARDVAVEFHSLSKTFNMTGWRIGFVCGNRDIVAALAKVKSNIDSGIFSAVQRAGIAALDNYESHINSILKVYTERRNVLVDGLNSLGWPVEKPKATFYVWIKVPAGHTSASFAKELLDKADIVATPGNGFGASGEGFVRMVITVDKAKLAEAVKRIRERLK
jgi:LL-diaminopimelate aminotransferase